MGLSERTHGYCLESVLESTWRVSAEGRAGLGDVRDSARDADAMALPELGCHAAPMLFTGHG